MNIKLIQKEIAALGECDGWLLYDFHGHNSIALEILQIPSSQMLSRRFYYWIPKSGTPVKIVHQIEENGLDHLCGSKIIYSDWKSLDQALAKVLKGKKKIAAEHSIIPTISKLDSALLEKLFSQKISVISSWPIASNFISRLTPKQFAMHKEASQMLVQAYESAWDFIKKKKNITEYDVQQHILDRFEGFTTDHPPIVAIGANSALAHYFPTKKKSSPIVANSPLLIDLWAKKAAADSVYADITQVCYIGKKAPKKIQEIYDIVYGAQRAAISFIQQQKKGVSGSDVDDTCRAYIKNSGYEKYFVHRTGHNIAGDLHGLGPNLDNFETNDTRELLTNACYSIEPGIYIPGSFGIRLECNIFIHDDWSVEVTGKSRKNLPCLC